MEDPGQVADAVLDGSARAAARLISWAEDRDERAWPALEAIHDHTGNAEVHGVTGPPGSGKSTLVDKLVDTYRERGQTVGVIAVDPSSPFTGGAVLADRIRMSRRSTDPDVFVRSMGSRGQLGGLAPAIHDAVRVLDAMGKDTVIVETMGVGQGEVDIVRTADTVALIAVPGLGDDIQTIKAGIMEIADVFAVNKADLEGVDQTVAELESHLRLAFEDEDAEDAWRPPIVQTIAKNGEGVDELVEVYEDHREHLEASGELDERRRDRAEHEILSLMKEKVTRRALEGEEASQRFEAFVDDVLARKTTPRQVADRLLER
jgi:LAO/AO transport system kinase